MKPFSVFWKSKVIVIAHEILKSRAKLITPCEEMIFKSVDKDLNLSSYNYHSCPSEPWKQRYNVERRQRFVMRKKDEKFLKEVGYFSKRLGR